LSICIRAIILEAFQKTLTGLISRSVLQVTFINVCCSEYM